MSTKNDTPRAQTSGEIRLVDVTKTFGASNAVENINLTIPHGSYCCLLGPSGCGKTTILRMIAGHETPTSGEIFIGGDMVVGKPPVERGTAMMFQSYALFPHLSRARQRRLLSEDARRAEGGASRESGGDAEARAAPHAEGSHAGAALGWPAAARGARPLAHHQSARAAARRAALGAGRVPAAAHAR